MNTGHASRTAEMVCMARAVANRRGTLVDPTAAVLLSPEARTRAEAQPLDGSTLRGRDRWRSELIARNTDVMVPRTLAIDAAIRERVTPQFVNLGAGLDGRPWRLAELANTVAFEVDHPATQAEKQPRAQALTPTAKAVHFVPVDFTRDSLERALQDAGHDPKSPTTWLWEGVVPYLTRPQVEVTLGVVARRSAPGSRLIIGYLMAALRTQLISFIVARVGSRFIDTPWTNEPLRSFYSARTMAKLLGEHGFRVVSDENLKESSRRLGVEARRGGYSLEHGRIVVAERI
jgi:methyltransferase (TIGR00027 family)